jgi:transposase InsO family protein
LIDLMRTNYSINELCLALGLSRSGYYASKRRPAGVRAEQNQQLLVEIRSVHADRHLRVYGSPRMTRELRDRGLPCSENRVARLMRQAGIQVRPRRAFRPRTTQPDHAASPSPNHLAEAPEAQRPGEQLVSDITYVPTAEGWLYLTIVLDLFSRAIVGWNLDVSLHAHGVVAAVAHALRGRRILADAIFHSDRGCQYTSGTLRAFLPVGWQQSMSATGCCYDNAFAECCFASIKAELLSDIGAFDSNQHARRAIFDYIEAFYNRRRKHSSLAYMAPVRFLELYFKKLNLHLN